MNIPYVDAHVHIYGYSIDTVKRFIRDLEIILLGVAEDLSSSMKVLELSSKVNSLIPAVGIHPWNIKDSSYSELEKVLEIAKSVRILGEIGLDKRFARESIDKQLEFLEKFLSFASENDLRVNLHTLDAWRDVFELLVRYEISGAIFHWYSGPIDLLNEIDAQGYFITINPAVKFQKKHREILKKAPIEMILTESDGPYNYKGVNLSPALIPDTVKEIARVKEIEEKEVKKIIYKNFQRYLS